MRLFQYLESMKRYFFATIILIILLIGATFVRWPLNYVGFKDYAELIWLNGVKYKSHDDVAYLEKNKCSEENPKDCVCVFMVHGLGDSAITWRQIFKLQKQLIKPTHFVAIDLPGAGASPFLETMENYKVTYLAKKYNALVKNLCGQQKVVLLSNSFGGWISSWMLHLEPQQYEASVLLNPAGLNKSYDKVVGNMIDPSPEKLMLSYRLSHNFGNNKKTLPWFVARHASARMRYFPVENMIKAQSLENLFIDSFLNQVSSKSHVIWGKDDGFLGPEHSESFQSLMPKSNFNLVENCAHIPQNQCTQNVIEVLNSKLAHIN